MRILFSLLILCTIIHQNIAQMPPPIHNITGKLCLSERLQEADSITVHNHQYGIVNIDKKWHKKQQLPKAIDLGVKDILGSSFYTIDIYDSGKRKRMEIICDFFEDYGNSFDLGCIPFQEGLFFLNNNSFYKKTYGQYTIREDWLKECQAILNDNGHYIIQYFYPNSNNIITEGAISIDENERRALRQGQWTYYSNTGKKQMITHYHDDNYIGYRYDFDEKGVLKDSFLWSASRYIPIRELEEPTSVIYTYKNGGNSLEIISKTPLQPLKYEGINCFTTNSDYIELEVIGSKDLNIQYRTISIPENNSTQIILYSTLDDNYTNTIKIPIIPNQTYNLQWYDSANFYPNAPIPINNQFIYIIHPQKTENND